MNNNFYSLLTWLEKQTKQADFADISLHIKIHAGKVTLVERTFAEKLKIDSVSQTKDMPND